MFCSGVKKFKFFNHFLFFFVMQNVASIWSIANCFYRWKCQKNLNFIAKWALKHKWCLRHVSTVMIVLWNSKHALKVPCEDATKKRWVKKGYKISVNNSLFCTACSALSISNANTSCGISTPNEVCKPVCLNGYKISSENNLTCLPTGTWSHDKPACIPDMGKCTCISSISINTVCWRTMQKSYENVQSH